MRLEAFEGLWAVEREIEDVRDGRSGRFRGTARFAPVPDGLAYREDGTLVFEGAPPLQASRRYAWRDGGAGTIEIRFEDGRFFHRGCADEPEPAAAHDCPPDHYRVRYAFRRWPLWQAEWRVRGPWKDYVMLSRFSPADRP
jgi:hypothetical protein